MAIAHASQEDREPASRKFSEGATVRASRATARRTPSSRARCRSDEENGNASAVVNLRITLNCKVSPRGLEAGNALLLSRRPREGDADGLRNGRARTALAQSTDGI